uniref:trypsin-like serine peptidase n=1 Tax=Gemmatimonas sp. TaxID=1962908 RepID=UPI00286C5FA0
MGEVQDRVQKARSQVMEEAFARWVGRWRAREEKRAAVAEGGPGAADSPTRRAVFKARESRRKALGMSSALERMIGGTWEGEYFASSDGARDAAGPVARLVEWGGEGFEPQGVATGFLVSPHLLLTNWHVIPDASCAVGMHANFGHQRTERGTAAGTLFALHPERFFTAHERLDFALVAVRPEGARGEKLEGIAPVRLIGSPGKIQAGDPMHVIQHPGGGPRQYAVRNNRLVDILEADGFLHYESDTLKGSSGSPVFNAHWELVALHHCGVPAMRGADVLRTSGEPWHPDADDEDTIQWVANEGARVSSIVAALRDTRLASDGEQRLLDALLTTTVDPLALGRLSSAQAGGPMATPRELAAADGPSSSRATIVTAATQPPTSGGVSMSSNVFNISGGTVSITVDTSAAVPLPIGASIVADGVSGARVTEARAGEPTAVAPFYEKSQNFDPNYSARPGYDPEFLGVEIPIPYVDEAHRGDLYSVGDYKQFVESARNVPAVEVDDLTDDEPLILNYHRYSLVANRVLRMAMFTASNADYSEEARQDPRPRTAFG